MNVFAAKKAGFVITFSPLEVKLHELALACPEEEICSFEISPSLLEIWLQVLSARLRSVTNTNLSSEKDCSVGSKLELS